jgi:hypothetical protein
MEEAGRSANGRNGGQAEEPAAGLGRREAGVGGREARSQDEDTEEERGGGW